MDLALLVCIISHDVRLPVLFPGTGQRAIVSVSGPIACSQIPPLHGIIGIKERIEKISEWEVGEMILEKREAAIEKETGRIEAFSDGVFAIAITLLVLDLKVPQLEAPSVATLSSALFRQWPSYLSFLTSFATILIMWVNHHTIFKFVHKSDTLFLFVNGFLLLLVTVVPFPTALVADYLTTPAAAIACATYAGIFVVINIAYNLLWWTASYQHRLLKPNVASSVRKKLTRNYLLGFPPYLVAALLAFWNAYLSIGICFGLWIFWALTAYEPPLREEPRHSDTFAHAAHEHDNG